MEDEEFEEAVVDLFRRFGVVLFHTIHPEDEEPDFVGPAWAKFGRKVVQLVKESDR